VKRLMGQFNAAEMDGGVLGQYMSDAKLLLCPCALGMLLCVMIWLNWNACPQYCSDASCCCTLVHWVCCFVS
jgi:hypothetical protein